MLKHKPLFLVVLATIMVLDQVTKWLSSRDGDISFNTGISLGLFSVLPSEVLTLILVAILVIVWWVYKDEWGASPVASGLFFGGGVSNVIDRLVYSSVRDWLPVPYLSIYNNLADYAIAIGLLIMLVNSLRKNYHQDVEDSSARLDHEETEEDV